VTTAAYPINVFWSTEDEAWVADTPDLHHLAGRHPAPLSATLRTKLWPRSKSPLRLGSKQQPPAAGRLVSRLFGLPRPDSSQPNWPRSGRVEL